MQRIFGALAVFSGWLCIPLAGVIVLVATEFLGLSHTEGDLPANGLYGMPAIVVLWSLVVVAVLTVVPAGAAMVATDPSRRLYMAAVAMAAAAVALLPDALGRAIDLAVLPGAGLFAVGGWWLHQAGEIGAPAPATTDEEPENTETGAPSVSASASGTSAVPAPAVPGPVAEPTVPKASKGKAPARGSKSRKVQAGPEVECPWCSAPTAPGTDRCPNCGAALVPLVPADADPIPGVTTIDPGLRAYAEKVARKKKRPGLLSLIMDNSQDRIFAPSADDVDRAVVAPPSAEVRAEMERLDREIAASRLPGDAPIPPPDASPPDSAPPPDAGA